MAVSHIFAFEVEHIQAMDEAFDAVCGTRELSTRTGDRASELVAVRIIELARRAECEKAHRPCPGRVRRRQRRIVVAALAGAFAAPRPLGLPPNPHEKPGG